MKRNHLFLGMLAASVLAVFIYHFSNRKEQKANLVEPLTRKATSGDNPRTITDTAPAQLPPSSDETHARDAARRLDIALAALNGITNANESQQVLSDLRDHIISLQPEVASAVIADFLTDPARDAATQIQFAVGKTGFLDGQPSLRIALLDWLGQIAPSQAGAVAKKILATPTSPDEWAVCLRNYARAYPDFESRQFLRAKTEELIRNPVWRNDPSVGFLEAFDVLVHIHATESSRFLGELVVERSLEDKALVHATYLTLDRLTICEPVAMMKELAVHPGLAKARSPMVANMFARADLRDAEQRKLVRAYLLDPARTPGELAAFAGVYPNANFALSKNLLTETKTPDGNELIAHDAAALGWVEVWLKDPAFELVKPYLSTMHNRLATFVDQASR